MCCKSQPDGRFWGRSCRRERTTARSGTRRANAGMYAKRNRPNSHTDWNRSSRTSYRFRRPYLPSHGGFGDKHEADDIWTLSQALDCPGCSCPNVGQEDPRDQLLQQPEARRLLRPGAPPLERARLHHSPPTVSEESCVSGTHQRLLHTHTQESQSSRRVQALTWTLNDPYFLFQK